MTYHPNDANNGALSYAEAIPPGGTTHTALSLAATKISYPNYIFLGWNTASNGTGAFYGPGDPIDMTAGNVIVYAQWKGNKYTVTYDANGGTGSYADANLTPGSTHTVLSQRDTGIYRYGRYASYSFIEWNTRADGAGTSYTPGNTFSVVGNVILYARWRRDESHGYTGSTSLPDSPPVTPDFGQGPTTTEPGRMEDNIVTMQAQAEATATDLTNEVNNPDTGGNRTLSLAALSCLLSLAGIALCKQK